jgi:hypothetical protein
MKASSGAAERVFIVVIILLMKQNVVRVWKHVRTSSPHPDIKAITTTFLELSVYQGSTYIFI